MPIPLQAYDHFHLFLSATWAQGQSDMRVVKQRLVELLPEVKVFLDVDNLEEGAGAEYIDRSEFILAFCTKRYFTSRACARELFRAVLQGKPIIAMLEPERSADKGGLTVDECKSLLVDAVYASCRATEDDDAPKDCNWVTQWHLDGEVTKWGIEWGRENELHPPSPKEIADAIFGAPPIEWSRFTIFQDVTMRLMAERLLPESHPDVYVQGEISQQYIRLNPLGEGRSFHLYVSKHNAGARDLGRELQLITLAQAPPKQSGGGGGGSSKSLLLGGSSSSSSKTRRESLQRTIKERRESLQRAMTRSKIGIGLVEVMISMPKITNENHLVISDEVRHGQARGLRTRCVRRKDGCPLIVSA